MDRTALILATEVMAVLQLEPVVKRMVRMDKMAGSQLDQVVMLTEGVLH